MPESRFGLQQRYTMDQILELHGGKARIQPLNYDALTQLRSPLYVKMGQTLADESSAQHSRILDFVIPGYVFVERNVSLLKSP